MDKFQGLSETLLKILEIKEFFWNILEEGQCLTLFNFAFVFTHSFKDYNTNILISIIKTLLRHPGLIMLKHNIF